jgi:HEPN domain-containing protein
MMEPEAHEWVRKAEEDFRTARALDPADVPNSICFHCQQCMEKYLKGAILEKGGIPEEYRHNLVQASNALAARDRRFEALSGPLKHLDRYAVDVRYPGLDALQEDAEEALAIASDLRRELRALLGLHEEPDVTGRRPGLERKDRP